MRCSHSFIAPACYLWFRSRRPACAPPPLRLPPPASPLPHSAGFRCQLGVSGSSARGCGRSSASASSPMPSSAHRASSAGQQFALRSLRARDGEVRAEYRSLPSPVSGPCDSAGCDSGTPPRLAIVALQFEIVAPLFELPSSHAPTGFGSLHPHTGGHHAAASISRPSLITE
jgi:hypothetical protein